MEEEQLYEFRGVDSFNNPESLGESIVAMAMNCVMRGGICQTRPGFETRFNLPCGALQGITSFKPENSPVHLVFAVDGIVYKSAFPFKSYARINGIQFDPKAKFIAWANTVQSFDYTMDGDLIPINPRSVLVMQDGFSPAAFWDGGEARHLNPAPSTITGDDGNIIFQPDLNETPMGLWMAWAGNRLWVSRGKQVFASDYGNPLKFTEQLYLAEGRSFYMPEDVTGMIQPTFNAELIVFGYNSITFIKANILERQQWLNTADFIRSESGVGCVAHRSIVKKNGLVWWYAPAGVINLNAALQFFNDSRLYYFDGPMMESKANISVFRERICSAEIEDYLLFSVPSGDSYNRHTWAADLLGGTFRWDGYWTGVRPVEWTTATIEGVERIFCVSRDHDGVNRLWEAFRPQRNDNGEPITSWVRTKNHRFNSRLNKQYRYSELFLDNILGEVDIMAAVGGNKGGYSKVYTQRISAADGPIEPFTSYPAGQEFTDNVGQFRQPKTQQADWTDPNQGCYTCNVESEIPLGTDRSFSHFILWSGQLGIQGYKMYAEIDNNTISGRCLNNETGPRSVNTAGCSSGQPFTVTNPLELFTAIQTVTVTCPEGGQSATVTSYANSYISQMDADKKALGLATKTAQSLVDCETVFLLTTEGGQIITTEDEIPIQI